MTRLMTRPEFLVAAVGLAAGVALGYRRKQATGEWTPAVCWMTQ